MKLEIKHDYDASEDLLNKKTNVICSHAPGLMPLGAYMHLLKVNLSEEEGELFYKTLQEKKETVCLIKYNITAVPLLSLSPENIKECFDANEKNLKCERMYFDLETTENNDLYKIIKSVFDNYEFHHTKEVYISSRSLKEKHLR